LIREQLVKSLRGGQAFDPLETILDQVPAGRRFQVPAGAERSAWQILDHMRRALEDLVAFSDNALGTSQEPDWPDDYWAPDADPGDPSLWDRTRNDLLAARIRMEELILDPKRDLTEQFPWGEGQTLLHEAILAIEHNAHHAGQLVELTRSLGSLGLGAQGRAQ
jgi:hypothetical protein